MANNAFGATKLTGGTAGALDDIIHTNITDGDLALVVDHADEKAYLLTYDSSSSETEAVDPTDDIIYVKPDSNGGNGRWVGVALGAAKWDGLRAFLVSTTLSGALSGLALEYDHIWIPATAMTATSTAGATATSSEEWDDATNDIMRNYMEFGASADSFACFDLVMPSAWDRGDIKFKVYWTGSETSSSGEDAYFTLHGGAVGDNEDLDVAVDSDADGYVNDTLQDDDTDKLHISPASGAITLAGTPALGDMVHFKLSRDISEETSSAAGAVRVFGIMIQVKYTNEVSAW